MNQQLKELAEQLDANGWAAELLDHRWHLVWVSDELLAVYGEPDAEQVGVGSHVLAARRTALSRGTIMQDSAERWLRLNGPFLLHDAGAAPSSSPRCSTRRRPQRSVTASHGPLRLPGPRRSTSRGTSSRRPGGRRTGPQPTADRDARARPSARASPGRRAAALAEQLDSDSRAARAALETARGLPEAVREVAGHLADEGLPIDPDDCRLKIAVHWGPSLYVGQVASQGRLEITALGDEMNEAARIEQCAAGGQVLASKGLVERLDEQDVAALGLDPSRVVYRAIADIEGVDEKARRDAGSVAVADLL